jgi:GST-like protein
MWTLYGSDGSGSAAVEMALLRCAVPFRVVRASTWEPDSAQAQLRQVNPLGQIPTLQGADGSVMTESAAILIELGLQFPASGLLPADPAGRGQAVRGLVYIAANCYAAIGLIDYPERWCSGGQTADHEKLRLGARARLHRLWEVFADQFPARGAFLGGDARLHRYWEIFADQFPIRHDFLGGAQPGALDLLAAVVSRWSGARAHLAAARPDLHALLLRVERDPALAPVFARHWPA